MFQQLLWVSRKLILVGRIVLEAILATTAFSVFIYILPPLEGDRPVAIGMLLSPGLLKRCPGFKRSFRGGRLQQ